MKKLLALVLATLMMIVPMSFSAYADDAAGPVVSVDLSGYATGGAITNAGSGTDAEFILTGSPTYGSFVNTSGEVMEYLRMGEVDAEGNKIASTSSNGLNIAAESLNNLDESTVVFWARYDDLTDTDRAKYPYLNYFRHASADESAYIKLFGRRHAGYEGLVSPGGSKFIDIVTGKWYRVSITQSYSDGTYTQKAYMNTRMAEDWDYTITWTPEARIDETDFLYQFGMGYPTSIAGIEIYDRVLTKAEQSAAYEAEKGSYEELVETETEMKLLAPTGNGVLSNKGGNLALTFNSIPSAATLSGITLTKVGDTANLITGATVSVAAKAVNLTYGVPEAGASYVLTVAGVKSVNDHEMAAPVTVNYIVGTDLAVSVNMTETGVTNLGSDTGASVTLGGAPTYHAFVNENRGKTSYFQMGVAPESGTGFVGDTGNNAVYIKSPMVNSAKEGTITVWMNQDVPIQNNAWGGNSYVHYGITGRMLFSLQPSYGDNSAFDLGASRELYAIYATRPYWYQVSVTWKYNDADDTWTATTYYNGGGAKTLTAAVDIDVADGEIRLGFGFPGKMSGMNVYSEAKAATDIKALYEAEKGNYKEVVETETELNLLAPTQGGAISYKGGKLALSFNSIPDPDALSGVTLVKEGTTDNIITGATVDGATKTAYLTYAAPEQGAKYVLTVEGVKSISGLELAGSKTFTYTVGNELAVDLAFSATGITNAGSDAGASISTTGDPTYGSFTNINRGTTTYMQIGVPDGNGGYLSGNTNNIKVVSPAMQNQNETTYSFWFHMDAEPTSSTYFYKTFMGYTDGTTTLAGYNTNRASIVRMFTEAELYDYALHGFEWVHYTFVRSYDEATSTMSIDLYIGADCVKHMEKVIDRVDESNFYFNFGAGIPGKISGVKLYDTAKTAAEVKALHDAEAASYKESEEPSFVGNVKFTNESLKEIDGFADALCVFADFTLKNPTEYEYGVKAMLALYEVTESGAQKLVKLSPALDKTLPAAENGVAGTEDFQASMELVNLDFTLTDKHVMKLLVWEDLFAFYPIVEPVPLPYGAQALPSTEGMYVIEHAAAADLNPATVMADNFSVTGADSMNVPIEDAMYIPQTNTIRLTSQTIIETACLMTSNGVLTVSGSDALINSTVYPYLVKTAPADAVTVISTRFFVNDTPVYNLANNSELRVLIQVANTSNVDHVNLPYTIRVNGDPEKEIDGGTVTIGRDSTISFWHELTDLTLTEGDTLEITI